MIPEYNCNDMIDTHVEDFISSLTQSQQDSIKTELLKMNLKFKTFEEMQNAR